MKQNTIVAVMVVGRLIAATLCVIIAGKLVESGTSGWGWFLFAALCFGLISGKFKKDSTEFDND